MTIYVRGINLSFDRLCDEFWTDAENTAYNNKLLQHAIMPSYDPKTIASYELIVRETGVYTGKVFILAVEDVVGTMGVINTLWMDSKLMVRLGENGLETEHWQQQLNALYTVLNKWKYVPNGFDELGYDRLFTNKGGIKGLINE